MEFYKTANIKTDSQLKDLISLQKTFFESMTGGRPAPYSNEYNHLFLRDENNNVTIKTYTWVDKTEDEMITEKELQEKKTSNEAHALAVIKEYKSNTEKWRTEKVKPLSAVMFSEWIDDTYLKPLKYNLTASQLTERDTKHSEILTYHNQTSYKDDYQLESSKPSSPSWI